jgi:transcriptional regulator with XRE-family HTH domain
MLSQIERGEANPTFSTLWNITRALGLELNDLVGLRSTSGGEIDILEPHYTPEIRTSDGLCVLRILNPIHSAGTTEWYELNMQPSGLLASEPHALGTREHLTVLSGLLQVDTGGRHVTLTSGMTARYAADTAHLITNSDSSPARALLVVTFPR